MAQELSRAMNAICAKLFEEVIISGERWRVIKARLRRERRERINKTRKREPPIGNKKRILVEHSLEHERHLLRLLRTLGLPERNMKPLMLLIERESFAKQANAAAAQRLRCDREQQRRDPRWCGCHLCGQDREDSESWLAGR